MNIDANKGAKRKVSYKNSSIQTRTYMLSTNFPKSLKFAHKFVEIFPLDSAHIGLIIQPCNTEPSKEIQVHMYDVNEPDVIVDCLMLFVNYCL